MSFIIISLILLIFFVGLIVLAHNIFCTAADLETTMFLNVEKYFIDAKDYLKRQIQYFYKDTPPKIAIIQIGNNSANIINKIIDDCEDIGIDCHTYYFDSTIRTDELSIEIADLAEFYDGLAILQPLPEHISAAKVTAAIPPTKDIAALKKSSYYIPNTPKGIIEYIEYCNWDPRGKHIVLISEDENFNKEIYSYFSRAQATVTICNSKTHNLWNFLSSAQLIITNMYIPMFLNCYAIHSPVIDVSGDTYNVENRKILPLPKGVDYLTRLALLENAFHAKLVNS